MVGEIVIGDRKIGARNPCFIVAEAGVNHNGSLEQARRLVEVAAECGADAVKFQTFKAEKLVSPRAPKAAYQLQTTGAEESQFDMLKRLELSPDAVRDLYAYSSDKGILFMSTPFDEESVDFLEDLGVPAFKVPSGDLTNLPLLGHIARKKRPVILSTGMAYLGEVETAVRAIEQAGNRSLVLLHCVSDYPARPADVNLRAMQTLALALGLPVGFSDHTLGIEVALAAVALGACVIEKHFTLDRKLPGPDHQASLEPDELAALVRGIRIVEASLGSGRKQPSANEASTAEVARKSLVAACDIPVGTRLSKEMVAIRRPGTGLPPALLPFLIGRNTRVSVPAGTLMTLEMLS